jgi:trigger factor
MDADTLKDLIRDSEKEAMKSELAINKAVDFVMANVKERAKAKSKKEEA